MSRQKLPEKESRDKQTLKRIGDRIRAARKRAGFSQEEFADVAQFSRSYYTEIETGKRNISLLNFIKILRTLKVDANSIISPARRNVSGQPKSSD